jgi:di/tricarboxylate transporter
LPLLPDAHAIAAMLMTLFALVLFAQDRIKLETSSLMVFGMLLLGFALFPYQGRYGSVGPADLFSGFGHEALVAVCALMILGKGLETTAALRPMARLLARLWRTSPVVSMLGTMLMAAGLSAVVNNTPIVVIMLPLLVGVTMSAKVAPSSVLMPFGLSTVIGGAMTTIGTSTNLLVVSVASEMGIGTLGMFDFMAPMALVGIVGIAFLWLVGPRLLPTRSAPINDQAARLYSAVLRVEEESKIAGMSLAEVRKLAGSEFRLLDVQRGKLLLARLPTLSFIAGDSLHVVDTPTRLKDLEDLLGVSLHEMEDEEPEPVDEEEASPADVAEANKQRLVEVVVMDGSRLAGSTIRHERFADEYGLYVLAIHRGTLQQEVRRSALADVKLMTGDVLLVQGSAQGIIQLKQSPGGLLVLDSTVDLPDTSKAPLALSTMVVVIALAALGVLPISVAAVLGVGAMLVTGCLSWKEAVSGLSTQVVMIIVTSLALGKALIATGAAAYVAGVFVGVSAGLPPPLLLGGLMLLMALLTNILSNNAAGIIGTPIAISIAQQLGLDPIPFVIAIIAGVNLSFATPMAYQTNLLVMHAGGYRFMDFVRIGVPLTLLMLIGYVMIIPRFFPF